MTWTEALLLYVAIMQTLALVLMVVNGIQVGSAALTHLDRGYASVLR